MTCLAGEQLHPHVLSTNMKERIQSSPLNLVLKEDCIVFPHTDSGMLLPKPKIVQAGQPAIRYPDVDRVVWAMSPKNDRYLKYLTKREELLKTRQEQALVSWCIKNNLPMAAEFELRRILRRIWNFQKPEYQRFCKQWIKFADKRQIVYTFPLPVEGVWFVNPDRTGHHRIKHGAAFAFDLMIKKSGKGFRGRGRNLEDHYCWGKPILAQADGIVTQAKDKNPDVPVGKSGGFANANFVSVYYGAGISGFYGHIQEGSLRVKVGQKVSVGNVLALVGNSGASGLPHLHFTMLDQSAFSVKGRFSFRQKKGRRWVNVNGKNLQENTYVKNWSPSFAEKPAE